MSYFSLFSIPYLSLYLVNFFCGIGGAWFITNYASKYGLVDIPKDRSSHELPVPKGGGIGILVAFVLSSLFLKIPLLFWLSATFLSLFSFLGDSIEIPPKFRLSLQFLAAIVLLLGIYGFGQNIIFNFIMLALMAIFIVGTANFYNFMDGIDGIAGLTGVVSFGILGFYAFTWSSNIPVAILAVCISIACLGFLPFNMPKAKVFMGDVGSILLGFVFAGMVALLANNFLDFICLTSFLFLFYADELTTMFVRLGDRESLTRAHRRHFYQILANERKISHWKISIGYGFVQLLVGISVLLTKPLGIISVLSLLMLYFSGFVLLSFNIRKNYIN